MACRVIGIEAVAWNIQRYETDRQSSRESVLS
jgi:hypothetical protein